MFILHLVIIKMWTRKVLFTLFTIIYIINAKEVNQFNSSEMSDSVGSKNENSDNEDAIVYPTQGIYENKEEGSMNIQESGEFHPRDNATLQSLNGDSQYNVTKHEIGNNNSNQTKQGNTDVTQDITETKVDNAPKEFISQNSYYPYIQNSYNRYRLNSFYRYDRYKILNLGFTYYGRSAYTKNEFEYRLLKSLLPEYIKTTRSPLVTSTERQKSN